MSLIDIFNFECDKLLNGVNLFRNLLPSESADASIHNGEEGIFVENLVIEFLKNSLPSQLGVSSGFVVRSRDISIRSGQVDILIYDKQKFAPLMKYGEAVVIHDKSLIAAISVKKNITRDEITSEFQALSKIGSICGKNGKPKPYLAVFAIDIRGLAKFEDTINNSFQKILDAFPERPQKWSANEIVNDLIVLNKFIIKKTEWKDKNSKEKQAKYIMCGGNQEHRNIYVQHLLYGISRVFNKIYDIDHSVLTNFPQINSKVMGHIDLCNDDRSYIPISKN